MPQERWFPRWLVAIVAALGVAALLWMLRQVLIPVFLGFIIAYLLDPIVDRFEARKLPRSVGIAVMLGVVVVVCGLFLLIAIPIVAHDLERLIVDAPELVLQTRERLEPLLLQLGVQIPQSLSEAIANFDRARLAGAAQPATVVLRWIAGGTISIVSATAWLLLIPVFAAYLLHDFDFITAGIRDLVPSRWRPFVVDVAGEVDTVLGEFVRGQLLVMAMLAVAYVVSFWLLGVRMALIIGVIGGVLSFIPYVGNAFALTMAILMCLVDWTGWGKVIGVVVAYTVIQTLEGFVITPRVVGDKVGLPAVWVLFALLVGGDMFGFLGVLLALPTAAVVKIFVIRGLDWYRSTEFFLSPEPVDPHGKRLWSQLLAAEGLPDDESTRAAKAAFTVPEATDPQSSDDSSSRSSDSVDER